VIFGYILPEMPDFPGSEGKTNEIKLTKQNKLELEQEIDEIRNSLKEETKLQMDMLIL